jgi:hypothetical protein
MNKIKVDGQILVVPNGYNFMGFDVEGIPEFSSGSFQEPKKVRKVSAARMLNFNSDKVENLPYGGVADQVRKKFKKVGDKGTVFANSAGTVRSAFTRQKMSASIECSENPNKFIVERMRKD